MFANIPRRIVLYILVMYISATLLLHLNSRINQTYDNIMTEAKLTIMAMKAYPKLYNKTYKGTSKKFKPRKKVSNEEMLEDKTKHFPITESTTLADLHDIIWKQIEILQEEGDCETKKIMHCENTKGFAGFGSMVHRYAVCMQVAYGLGRMFFIEQPEYAHFGGLQRWLQPESKKCHYIKANYKLDSSTCNMHDPQCYHFTDDFDVNNTYRVLVYNLEQKFPAPKRIPGTIPKEIEQQLIRLNIPDPWLWFTSQFVGYLLLRTNKNFNAKFQDISKSIKFQYPIVGIHIRHGDKIGSSEAKYVNEEVYIKAATTYFHQSKVATNYFAQPKVSTKHISQSNSSLKRIYVASDDLNIYNILHNILPNHTEIIMLSENYREKGLKPYVGQMVSANIIESILLDIYFLLNSNYTVCTYSSNVCRLLYELRQASPPYNSSHRIESVDVPGMFYVHPGYRALDISFVANKDVAANTTVNGIELLQVKQGEQYWRSYDIRHDMYKIRPEGKTYYGNVMMKDLTEWPGRPKYYFYP